MLRLRAALLVAWFALLGSAMPALACETAIPGHCCPVGGTSAPCPNDVAGACCTPLPNPTYAASSPSTRAEGVEPTQAHTVLPGPAFALQPTPVPYRDPLALMRPPAAEATPVFLRTLRLRL